MKKLILALAATTVFAAPAMAQSTFGDSNTDSTTVTATIAAVCTVNAPAGGAISADEGSQNPIGDSAAQCNDPDGFDVVLSSANAGDLRGANSSNATTLNYLLRIVGAGSYDLTTPQTLPGTARQEAVDGFALPTFIDVGTANGPRFADAYSDTITYTITAR